MALQLRDNRAPYAEAKQIVEDFAAAVERDGDHAFEREEAVQILDSIYESPPRDPWATSKTSQPVPQVLEPDPDIRASVCRSGRGDRLS